jgi:hypothetical protein
MVFRLTLWLLLADVGCATSVVQRFLNASSYPGIPEEIVAQYLDPPAFGCPRVGSSVIFVELGSQVEAWQMPSAVEIDGLNIRSWSCGQYGRCQVTYDLPPLGDPHPLVQAMHALYPHPIVRFWAMRPLSAIVFPVEGVVATSQGTALHAVRFEECQAREAKGMLFADPHPRSFDFTPAARRRWPISQTSRASDVYRV